MTAEGKPSTDPTSEGRGDAFNFLDEDLIKLKVKGLAAQSKVSLQ
jgi:hypothetical protein